MNRAPYSFDGHIKRATRANVVLDLITASLVALIVLGLRRRLGGRIGESTALLGFVAIVLAPPMCLLASYAMTESLATMLGTLEVALALLLLDGEARWPILMATGFVAGVHQLVRADAITFAPAVAIALYAAPLAWKQRLVSAALIVGVAAAVFTPWPIRNLLVFGEAHPFASYWRTIDGGTPLPMGPIAWARTWATGQEGETFFDYSIAVQDKLSVDRIDALLPHSFDSSDEHKRLHRLVRAYNRDGLSPAVDAEFHAIAAERRARRPFHVYIALPLQRLGHMFCPVPYWELPMKVDWLHLGEQRGPLCYAWDFALYALALLGAFSLLRARPTRLLCLILVAPIVVRAVLLAYTVALGATERHLVEIHPLLALLAVIGISLNRVARPPKPAGVSAP